MRTVGGRRALRRRAGPRDRRTPPRTHLALGLRVPARDVGTAALTAAIARVSAVGPGGRGAGGGGRGGVWRARLGRPCCGSVHSRPPSACVNALACIWCGSVHSCGRAGVCERRCMHMVLIGSRLCVGDDCERTGIPQPPLRPAPRPPPRWRPPRRRPPRPLGGAAGVARNGGWGAGQSSVAWKRGPGELRRERPTGRPPAPGCETSQPAAGGWRIRRNSRMFGSNGGRLTTQSVISTWRGCAATRLSHASIAG
jgi:hypothetical protein